MKISCLLFAIVVWSQAALAFRPFIIRSGKSQIHLLEYYDSQSCTTCDEQRKWISDLGSDQQLFKKFIIASFDADKNADRLKGLSLDPTEDGTAFALDGVEWLWAADSKISGESTPIVGELEVARSKFQEFELTFTPKQKFESGEKLFASGILLGSGKTPFKVLEMNSKEIKKVGSSYVVHLKFSMKKQPDVKSYSAVFWISKDDNLKPIQAVGANLTID